MLNSTNILMVFLCLVFLCQALFVHEKQFFHQVTSLR